MNSRSRRPDKVPSRTEPAGASLASRGRGVLPTLLAALAVLGAGLWFGGFFDSGNGGEERRPAIASSERASPGGTPEFVSLAPARVRDAYAFAATNSELLAYIPCYCGCGGHSGHRDVRDCFIKKISADGVTYEKHGSECDVCVSIVLDTKEMLAEGMPLTEVRAEIDAAYEYLGPGTDTPFPPGMEE